MAALSLATSAAAVTLRVVSEREVLQEPDEGDGEDHASATQKMASWRSLTAASPRGDQDLQLRALAGHGAAAPGCFSSQLLSRQRRSMAGSFRRPPMKDAISSSGGAPP